MTERPSIKEEESKLVGGKGHLAQTTTKSWDTHKSERENISNNKWDD